MITNHEVFRLIAVELMAFLPPSIRWNDDVNASELFLIDDPSEQERRDLAPHLHCPQEHLGEPRLLLATLTNYMQQQWTLIDEEQGPVVTEEEFVYLARARSCALFLHDRDAVVALGRAMELDERAAYDGFEDNGGDPDGNAWLIWDLDARLIQLARHAKIDFDGVDGFLLSFPRVHLLGNEPLSLEGGWSGISCSDMVFVLSEADAVRILRTGRYINEHFLVNRSDEEVLEALSPSFDPSDQETPFTALARGSNQAFTAPAFDGEAISLEIISQLIRSERTLAAQLIWSHVDSHYYAYQSSPIREVIVFLADVANRSPEPEAGLVERVLSTATRVVGLLFDSPLASVAPPDTFWHTSCGKLIRHIQHWALGSDLINYTEAARLIWEEQLSRPVATQRIQRAVLRGTLAKYQDPREPNPQRANRVSRSQVEAIAHELRTQYNR